MSKDNVPPCPTHAMKLKNRFTRRKLLPTVLPLAFLPLLHFPQWAVAGNTHQPGTMAIREVTTGTLLFQTAEPGRFVPAPSFGSWNDLP